MKRLLLLNIIFLLTACNFKEKKEEITYPFKNINITSLNQKNENKIITDSVVLYKFSESLKELSSQDLIKGKRLHGAEKLCDIELETQKNQIAIFISLSKEKEIVMSFFEFKEDDNFNYFLGALYDNDKMIEIVKESNLNCFNKE